MRVVVDTNVIVSGLFFSGTPRAIINLIKQDKIKAFASREIVKEYCMIFERMQLLYLGKERKDVFDELMRSFYQFEVFNKISICRDEDDNKFIECAVSCNADYIITGDKDLLVLQKYKNIEIVTPKEFVDLINSEISEIVSI